jgi:hypothetical protein
MKPRIPSIIKRFSAPVNHDAYKRYLEAQSDSARLEIPDSGKMNFNAVVLNNIECRAFAYAVEGKVDMGKSAVKAMREYLERTVGGDYNVLGQIIFTAGTVYDWCYDLMSKDDKDYFCVRALKIAEGLENILSLCPECGGKYTLRTKKNRISCECCGLSATVDNRYAFGSDFRFENFKEWYNFQVEKYKEVLESDPDFKLTSKVTLKHSSKDGKTILRYAGQGECILDRTGLLYRGTEDGEEITKHFPIDKIYRLLFGAGENFEVYEGKEIYYFVPEIPQSSVDWYIYSKLIYDSLFTK